VIANLPYYQADKIETPMLIMQGEDDAALIGSQKLFVALRRLDKPVQLAIYKCAGHGLPARPRAQAVDGAERIMEFLDRHVKMAGM
jgi:dipeptidyl aminopeptidase/acylaminoacyl peptidase